MTKQEILKLFHDSVAGTPVGYKSLYECDCPFLKRDLGFRDQFKELALSNIKATHKPTEPLVYVCQGPGGFLWDFHMINSLIDAGYHTLTLVFIEPLYEKNMGILQAYLDLQAWYACLKAVYKAQITLTTHLFKSFREYEQNCLKNPHVRGNLLITVDPDDKKTVPDFDNKAFLTKLRGIFAKTMQNPSLFYYLYFQKAGNHPYRHIILGSYNTKDSDSIAALKHIYGETTTSQSSHNRVFINNKEVF